MFKVNATAVLEQNNALEMSWRKIWDIYFLAFRICRDCRQTSDISRALVGNETVHHSDVVGASSVGAAPAASSIST